LNDYLTKAYSKPGSAETFLPPEDVKEVKEHKRRKKLRILVDKPSTDQLAKTRDPSTDQPAKAPDPPPDLKNSDISSPTITFPSGSTVQLSEIEFNSAGSTSSYLVTFSTLSF
jgi:hypothetical protein